MADIKEEARPSPGKGETTTTNEQADNVSSRSQAGTNEKADEISSRAQAGTNEQADNVSSGSHAGTNEQANEVDSLSEGEGAENDYDDSSSDFDEDFHTAVSGEEPKETEKDDQVGYMVAAIVILSAIFVYTYYGVIASYFNGESTPLAHRGDLNVYTWKDGKLPDVEIFSDEHIQYVDDGIPYLIILGHVFDVSKGFESYKPGTGYHGFIGRDGSRAFVTGDFTEKGFTNDVTGLTPEDYLGLAHWVDFYFKTYTFKGYHHGLYFDENGDETEAFKQFKSSLNAAYERRNQEAKVKEMFPPCNMEWSETKGTVFWCSTRSGGVERDWEGLPYKFKESPDKPVRCSCAQKEVAQNDPRFKPYPGCENNARRCEPKEEVAKS